MGVFPCARFYFPLVDLSGSTIPFLAKETRDIAHDIALCTFARTRVLEYYIIFREISPE